MATSEDAAALTALAAKLAADATADAAAYAGAQATITAQAAEIAALKAQLNPPTPVPAPVPSITPPIASLPKLAWHDEFDGTAVDTSKWNVRDGAHANNERSIDWARNVSVSNSNLVIQPKLETSTAGGVTRQYTSGYVDTNGKYSPTGPFYMEFRAQMPLKTGASAGMWPALWTRGSSGAGELDIFEGFELGAGAGSGAISEQPHGKLTNHIYADTNSGAGKAGYLSSTVYDLTAWHTYGALVKADSSIDVYFDGKVVKSYPVGTYSYLSTAFAGGHNIRLNLQIGSNYYGGPDGNTDWSQQMRVDYVRVWTP